MTTLIKETETERHYIFEQKKVGDKMYYHVRVYTLTDRWRRTKDQWYVVEKETEFIEYTRSVYYRGVNRREYHAGEISITLEIPTGDDPDFYWNEAHVKMDALMEQEPEHKYHWSNPAVTEKTGTRYVQSLLDGTLIRKETYRERSGADWRKLRYKR